MKTILSCDCSLGGHMSSWPCKGTCSPSQFKSKLNLKLKQERKRLIAVDGFKTRGIHVHFDPIPFSLVLLKQVRHAMSNHVNLLEGLSILVSKTKL